MPPARAAGRHLLDVDDLSDDEVRELLREASAYAGGKRAVGLGERLVATLFFEPSTRTRLSFEAAAHRLGAKVIGFSDAAATSTRKGETLEDTVRTVSGYADLLVLRHPDAGSAARAAKVSGVPVVNAGDGANAHPTQALLDLYTIQEERGRPDDHDIVLFGDLRHGRTVHSLAVLLARFANRLTFVAPPGLEMPEPVVARCRALGAAPRMTHDINEAVTGAGILYVTRVQQERIADNVARDRFARSYTVDEPLLARARDDLLILHPLPRVNEIPPEVDTHPGAAYFRQAANGVPVRMAILARLLNETRSS